jgi:hypothetical protein
MLEYKPESELDHFKFWKVKPKDFSKTVSLKGQFDGDAISQTLERLEWIANPVDKTHKEKRHEAQHQDAHLLGCFLAQPTTQPAHWVKFQNQLYDKPEVWQLAAPVMLLVPASKVYTGNPPDWPKTLSHFQCYLVRDAEPVNGPVLLEDQFDRKRDQKEDIKTLDPAFFCLPVTKDKEQIHNPRAHLALYDLGPRATYAVTVFARDQFGKRELEVEESLMLGVPTEKLQWGKGKRPTATREIG